MFTPEDAVEIVKDPAVERCMKASANDPDFRHLPGTWEGRPIAPFLMLRKLVEKSVGLAIIQAPPRELARLLILLKMTDIHDSPRERADAVGRAAESYAVRMLFGTDGLDSYRAFMRTQDPTGETP